MLESYPLMLRMPHCYWHIAMVRQGKLTARSRHASLGGEVAPSVAPRQNFTTQTRCKDFWINDDQNERHVGHPVMLSTQTV